MRWSVTRGRTLLTTWCWSSAAAPLALNRRIHAISGRNAGIPSSTSVIALPQATCGNCRLAWGAPFMNRGGLLNVILGGWQTNGILTVQTGQPFSPVLQTSTTNGTGSRPDVVGTVNYPKTLQRWFDPSAFATPAPFTYGNAGRNILFGPGRTNWDASLFKNFVIREEIRFEFRAEAFNVLNHPQFGLPNQNIGNAQVGSITSIVGNPRQLQLGLRFQF